MRISNILLAGVLALSSNLAFGAFDACGHETAFARPTESPPDFCCFVPQSEKKRQTTTTYHSDDVCDKDGNRWGWEITIPANDFTETFPLHAGAGQCDITKGTVVGEVVVNRDLLAKTLTVEYSLFADFHVGEVHVNVEKERIRNPAPGQYTTVVDDLPFGTQSWTETYSGLDDVDYYTAYHAAVFAFGEGCEAPSTCENTVTVDDTALTFDCETGFSYFDLFSTVTQDVVLTPNNDEFYLSDCVVALDGITTFRVYVTPRRVNSGAFQSTNITLSYTLNAGVEECTQEVVVSGDLCKQKKCQSTGDPHTRTFDGKRHHWGNDTYANVLIADDLRIVGEHRFVLLDQSQPSEDGNWRFKGTIHVSTYKGVVFRYKDTVVELVSEDNEVIIQTPRWYTLNDASPEMIQFRSVGVQERNMKYFFTLPDGTRLLLRSRRSWNNNQNGFVVDVHVFAGLQYQSSVTDGVCGNWNGNPVDDYEEPWMSTFPTAGYPTNPLDMTYSEYPSGATQLLCRYSPPKTNRNYGYLPDILRTSGPTVPLVGRRRRSRLDMRDTTVTTPVTCAELAAQPACASVDLEELGVNCEMDSQLIDVEVIASMHDDCKVELEAGSDRRRSSEDRSCFPNGVLNSQGQCDCNAGYRGKNCQFLTESYELSALYVTNDCIDLANGEAIAFFMNGVEEDDELELIFNGNVRVTIDHSGGSFIQTSVPLSVKRNVKKLHVRILVNHKIV
eukprot:Awhi_evm1s13046